MKIALILLFVLISFVLGTLAWIRTSTEKLNNKIRNHYNEERDARFNHMLSIDYSYIAKSERNKGNIEEAQYWEKESDRLLKKSLEFKNKNK